MSLAFYNGVPYFPGEEGDIPNGSRIVKTQVEEGDWTPIGAEGFVLSSIKGPTSHFEVLYFVVWDHDENQFPVGVLAWKIDKA